MAQPHDRNAVVMSPPMMDVPTPEEILAVRPAKAAGLEGRVWAQITCGFTAEGRLVDCAPVKSSHPGLGLEQAVISLADRFRLEPRFVQRWMGASVAFTVSFGPPWAEPPAPPVLRAPPVEARQPLPPTPRMLAPPSPPAPPSNPVLTKPDWVQKPSGEAVTRAYPKAALAAELGGRVTLSCLVNADGTVSQCKVISENPADMGFGEAAVSLSRLFRMRDKTADGIPVGGATVRIPLSFSVPEPEPPPEPKR